jgi:hypothetical protein
MSDRNYKFLPSDGKILRLETCDFYLQGERNDSNVYQVQCGLKKISNPILILFYYNNTDQKILTQFFQASRNDDLDKGKAEDNYRDRELTERDLEFRFGSVNLDYETSLFESFGDIEIGNPFKWLQIVGDKKYPFMVFYYQTLPQYMYEGRVTSQMITSEFRKWYQELMEDKEENRERKDFQDGIYMAVTDGEKDYYSDFFKDEKKKFIYRKGEIFKVFLQDSFVIFSRDLEAGSFEIPKEGKVRDVYYSVSFIGPIKNTKKYELDMDEFYTNFRKLDVSKENEIDKEKEKMYREMYQISHPGNDKKVKKDVFLDKDFFTTGFGSDESSLDILNSFITGAGLDKDYIKQEEIKNGFKLEKEKRDKFNTSMTRKKELENLIQNIKQALATRRINDGKDRNIRELNALPNP